MNDTLTRTSKQKNSTTNYKRYKFLFENSPIPIHETNVNNVVEAIDRLKAEGITDIKEYLSNHPTFIADLFDDSDIFDVNDAMLLMTEADSKAYYIENFKKILGEPCFQFFQAVVIAFFDGQNSLSGSTQITTFKGRKIWIEATAIFLSMDGEEVINYTFKEITEQKRKNQAIQLINERLVTGDFQAHLNNLVSALSEAFDLSHVFIGTPNEDFTKINTLAFSAHKEIQDNASYFLSTAPCLEIYERKEKVIYSNHLDKIYPNASTIKNWEGKSYLGYPLRSKKGDIIGHFAFVHQKPIQNIDTLQEIMELYASWASTELENLNDKKILEKHSQTIQNQLQGLNLKNQELERYIESNVQLKNFAYIASHDLKAPIRTIISFLQLLKRELKGTLNERSVEYMDFITSASKNMRDLIDDLLSYSTIDGQPIKNSALNVQRLIDIVTSGINASIKEKNAIIECKNLPEIIRGDSTKLKQLFQNLLSNAIKFTPEDKQPIIIIDSEEQENHWLFSIKDNGIGIDEAYFSQIFDLFNKLHGRSDYEGTGLGLAICKKIVEKHNGKISVKSTLGQGSTFYFTIEK
jgi:signal transduction histidine kinase